MVVALTNVMFFTLRCSNTKILILCFYLKKDYLKGTYFDLKALSDVSSLDIIHFSAI